MNLTSVTTTLFLSSWLFVMTAVTWAGPRESVAVAIAVDALLQSSTPALPDTLGVGEVTLDLAAVERAGRPARRTVYVFVADEAAGDAPCPPCRATVASLGRGDDDVEVLVRSHREAPWPVPALPTVWLPDVDKIIPHATDLPRLKATLAAWPAPTAATSAISIGTLRGRHAVAMFFEQLSASRVGTVLTFGPMQIALPARLSVETTLTPDVCRVTFTGPAKPRLQVGTGWLAAGRALSSVTLARDRVTLGLDGFPDLQLMLTD